MSFLKLYLWYVIKWCVCILFEISLYCGMIFLVGEYVYWLNVVYVDKRYVVILFYKKIIVEENGIIILCILYLIFEF